MCADVFDPKGNKIDHGDVQDRPRFYAHGESQESRFVSKFQHVLGVQINPQKRLDVTVPDLTCSTGLADLKHQATPFFTAADKAKIDPQYAVTFNVKDAWRYHTLYPDIQIFFWVEWKATGYRESSNQAVQATEGVWRVSFRELDAMRSSAHIHWYHKRPRVEVVDPTEKSSLSSFEKGLRDHNGKVYSPWSSCKNAACSYIFDVRTFTPVVPVRPSS